MISLKYGKEEVFVFADDGGDYRVVGCGELCLVVLAPVLCGWLDIPPVSKMHEMCYIFYV